MVFSEGVSATRISTRLRASIELIKRVVREYANFFVLARDPFLS